MKSLKKAVAVVLVGLLVISFSGTVFAEELPPVESGEESPIYGLDAYVRDCTSVNLRSQASSSSPAIMQIDCDEHVTVIDQTGKWFLVSYDGISGYISWKYIKFTEPEITPDSELIGNSIIHYTSSENRDHNMAVACDTIDGMVIEPGEQFIWSEVIGQTTTKKGYKKAPVIINRVSTPGLGGGVCQVSTTLYNATFDTEIEPDEVHEHSIGCAYAERDATVAHGSKNFIFTNPYDYPIKLEAYSYKAVVFVNIYKAE